MTVPFLNLLRNSHARVVLYTVITFFLIGCHILYAIIRHFHAQVVISSVLSSCSGLLNKTSTRPGSGPDWLPASARTAALELPENEHREPA